jgi:hypothetical protein
MKRTDTNTIHNTPLQLHVNTQNPKKNVGKDNVTMWLSSTTEKNMDQLEDRLVLNYMATCPMTISPNEKWCNEKMCTNICIMSGVLTDRQVSLQSLCGTNRNKISIAIELESFWSQESPNKKMQYNCKWQIYCYLPDSWIRVQQSIRPNNTFNMLWHWQ